MPTDEFANANVQTNDVQVAQVFCAHNLALQAAAPHKTAGSDQFVTVYAKAFNAAYKAIGEAMADSPGAT